MNTALAARAGGGSIGATAADVVDEQSQACLDNSVRSPVSMQEPQRGRRRVRSPLHLSAARSGHHDESRTFRGRCRNRSTSHTRLQSCGESLAAEDERDCPLLKARRHLAVVKAHDRRRNQSPSRSRSANATLDEEGAEAATQRRRQRTRSWGRTHRLVVEGKQMGGGLTINSPLQFEVGMDEGEGTNVVARQ